MPIVEETARTRVFLLYGDPDEPGWAQAWLDAGSGATRDALAPSAPLPADLDVRPRITRADDSCRDGSYRTFNRWRTRRYGYYVNTRTLSAAFRRAVIRGHHAWDRTRNGCGYGDQDNIASTYRGHRGGSIHTHARRAQHGRPRAASAVCGNAVTLACAWTFTDAGGRDRRDRPALRPRAGAGRPRAARRTTTSRAWRRTRPATRSASATPARARYLTMHHQMCAGCTFARTLGRGDVRGLRALY